MQNDLDWQGDTKTRSLCRVLRGLIPARISPCDLDRGLRLAGFPAKPPIASAATIAITFTITIGLATTAFASDLTSSSFKLRGGHFSASGSVAQVSQSGLISSSGSLGQSESIGLASLDPALATIAPGFWPVASGDLPSIDGDGDGIHLFSDNCANDANPAQLDFDSDTLGDACDLDDDNDGLADDVETNSGTFVSASDTGTNPLDDDSDSDGFTDGAEVDAGSDPTNPLSTPDGEPQVPTLTEWMRWFVMPILFVAIGVSARSGRRPREMQR